ncbi:MAG: hypothetical protein HKN21_13605 [Candidatus Eisenbacteria bacterium]|uniref:Uncharacterized protein n=1 Tax=Eiseniibacteriota bacterium TaxID=2212470 RepID=A0A7Y2EDE7_UNCEI|nr:hypothetical protein [Candidatus Eisenbacteria bacterium]
MKVPQPDYTSHPMLNPSYLLEDTVSASGMKRMFVSMRRSPTLHNRSLNRLLNPLESPMDLKSNLEAARRYFIDVSAYLHEVLQLVGAGARKSLASDPEVMTSNDVLGLLELAFRGDTKRIRFEAQRKLYLAKLFFDIDHDPGIQKGEEHKSYFERTLDRELWAHAARMKPVDVYYDIDADGVHMKINTKKTAPHQERWRFYLMRLRRTARRRKPIHIYHYACRFKREVAPLTYVKGAQGFEAQEQHIWKNLQERRSGSILSKMIRKGVVHPRKIQDIIGAMFIVKDRREVLALQEVLFEIFGGPLKWKDRVNTITRPEDRKHLHAQSASGYEVLKSDVDVLHNSTEDGGEPYIFSVEVQIYTVEGYLRTVHSGHFASHQNLKLRQFLEGLLPPLFPVSVYGEETIAACMDDLSRVAREPQPQNV